VALPASCYPNPSCDCLKDQLWNGVCYCQEVTGGLEIICNLP